MNNGGFQKIDFIIEASRIKRVGSTRTWMPIGPTNGKQFSEQFSFFLVISPADLLYICLARKKIRS
jgi:hypothetical protein